MGDKPDKNLTPKPKKAVKPFYKKKWFLVTSSILVLILLFMFLTGAFGKPFAGKPGQAVDLKGMTVQEACDKAKKNGWKNVYVTVWSSGDDYRQSDCSSELEVQDYELDSGYCWGVSTSSSTDHNVCIKAYDNGYTGPKKTSSSNSSSDKSESSSSSSSTTTQPSSSSSSSSQPSSNSSSSSSSSNNSSSSSSSSTDASFRKVMADYESFMNKYVDFMKKYKNSSDTTSMLSEYSSLMQDYAKFADSIKGYNQNNLSASDWAYYLEVTARVTKKLAEI